MLKKVYLWLVSSSVDPTKWSATIKGFGLLAAPYIVTMVGLLFSVNLDQSMIVQTFDMLATLAGLGLGAFGVSRKLYLTWKNWRSI